MSRAVQLIALAIFVIALVHTSEAQSCSGGPNDEYTNCGSWCPPTCEQPQGGTCQQSCKENTCQCQRGYVRRSDGQCVQQSEC